MAHHLALYAGTFDPITFGHLDVLRRARNLFDELVLGIGHNPDKRPLFPVPERIEMISTPTAMPTPAAVMNERSGQRAICRMRIRDG